MIITLNNKNYKIYKATSEYIFTLQYYTEYYFNLKRIDPILYIQELEDFNTTPQHLAISVSDRAMNDNNIPDHDELLTTQIGLYTFYFQETNEPSLATVKRKNLIKFLNEL